MDVFSQRKGLYTTYTTTYYNKMKAKCLHKGCDYEWETNSSMIKVSCPSCGNKVQIRDKLDKEKVVEDVK